MKINFVCPSTGHGYKTFVGKDNLLRYGGGLYDPLVAYPDVAYSQRSVSHGSLYIPLGSSYVGRYTVRDLSLIHI